jgi:tetratricopeptide (TPR) repeat protein
MKVRVLTFCVTLTLCAADDRQLALALKAQTDFERVELAPKPPLADSEICQQSQAAELSVAPPEEAALLHFRKGWCALAGAAATGRLNQPSLAIAEFDRAKEAWPARLGRNAKNAPSEPVSSGLRAIVAILRMQAGEDARAELADVVDHPVCNSNLMSPEFCRQLLEVSRQWMGWVALREGRLEDAARLLAWSTDSGWSQWVQGRRSFDSGAYPDAVANYTRAIDIWNVIWSEPSLLRALGPRPSMPVALADLGGAQMLAGNSTASIRTLDTAVKADPSQAHPLFLRARAKEIAGQSDAALADYSLAARTAFASAQDLASGEAHLYRGIVLYRRKDFPRAEDEFASALNFEIPAALRGDAVAWRHVAAVAGGSCGSERESLVGSIGRTSPFFPKEEARTLAATCGGSALR